MQPEEHTEEELVKIHIDLVRAVMHTIFTHCQTHKHCPACAAEVVSEALLAARDQLPHLADGETFEVREVKIHPTAGNA